MMTAPRWRTLVAVLALSLSAGSPLAADSATATRTEAGPTFVDIGAPIEGLVGSVEWGDFDNDGDLDFVESGRTDSTYATKVYRNDGGGVFSDLGVDLPTCDRPGVAWGDYDRDGDLDLVVATKPETRLFRNDGPAGFNQVWVSLFGFERGSAAFGDCDNDGDLDLLLSGDSLTQLSATVYLNDGHGGLVSGSWFAFLLAECRSAWGDFDGDGDLDIVLSGLLETKIVTLLYRNDGKGRFEEVPGGLPGVFRGSNAWGDFDSDGDLDLLLTGLGESGPIAPVCRNDGSGGFVDAGANLSGMVKSVGAWGDFDSDGDLDVVLAGTIGTSNAALLFRNDGATGFTAVGTTLQGLSAPDVAWGDYDNDGDLDLLLAGYDGAHRLTRIYRNDGTTPNLAPQSPTDLSSPRYAGRATLGWLAAIDPETPSTGLTYNLRMGTTPGAIDVVTPMSSPADGYRRLVDMGNLQHGTTAFVEPLPPGTYYWSVQAVDTAFAGSPFAAEGIAEVCSVGIDPTSRIFPYAGGTLAVTVSTEPNCAWTTGAVPNWIQVTSGTTGVGPGTVTISVSPNEGPARGCTIDIGGQALTVSQEQPFPDIGATLLGVWAGMGAWGDYDNDGDLDVFLFGCHDCSPGGSYENYSKLYRNDGPGVFTDSGASFEGQTYGSAAWGDFDSDGDLDLLFAGAAATRVYRNDGGGTFFDIGAGLSGVTYGSASWADYDSDGDLDILVTGAGGSAPGWTTRLYRNDGGIAFSEVSVDLVGVQLGSTDWGDFDNDGDLDLALIGQGTERVSKVYRNDGGGVFSDLGADLVGVSSGSITWGDYDSDGDLDLLMAGDTYSAPVWGLSITKVYRNDGGGVFTDANVTMRGVLNGSAEWCDLDNDGNLDALVTGHSYSAAGGDGEVLARVYLGDGTGGFAETDPGIAGISEGNATCGDFDNDGDLDVLTVGLTMPGLYPASRIYRNDAASIPNVAPSAPVGLEATGGAGHAVFRWNPSSDPTTPSPGLTYNLRVGTTPGGYDVVAPMASLADGWRRLPKRGSIGPGTTALLTSLEPGTYYWSVQAIDTAFAGSLFAPEATFTIAGAVGTDTPGVYRSSDRSWYLKNSNGPGAADLEFPYGDPSDQAVKGDWDGNGTDTVGIYRDGVFYLKNTNAAGNADLVIGFGLSGDVPVAGDWDGDGIDTIGVYRPADAAWFLRNTNAPGAPDLSFTFGLANETPVVGDWDGDGVDTVGIFRASDRQWYLHNSNAGGNAELVFPYGDPAQDVPVVGDWDGDGDDTVGIYRAALGEWFLKNSNEAGFADLNFVYGLVNEKPLAGDWDGN